MYINVYINVYNYCIYYCIYSWVLWVERPVQSVFLLLDAEFDIAFPSQAFLFSHMLCSSPEELSSSTGCSEYSQGPHCTAFSAAAVRCVSVSTGSSQSVGKDPHGCHHNSWISSWIPQPRSPFWMSFFEVRQEWSSPPILQGTVTWNTYAGTSRSSILDAIYEMLRE